MAEIKIKNRSNGTVAYTIPELGDRTRVRREFAPKEVKTITFEELEALTFIGGGQTLLEEYLQVSDREALTKLGIVPEYEYFMSEEDIKALVATGSYDSFLDALDFAPEGVIDLIKKYAVELPCNDNAKRDALRVKKHFDVDQALRIIRESTETTAEETTSTTTKQRRVQVETAEVTPETPRRPKYNVVG